MIHDKESIQEVNTVISLNRELSWDELVEISRRNNNTFFAPAVMKLNQYDKHGEVYSGKVNWFFVVSKNPNITSMDENIRKYHVHAFTPRARVLTPHNPDDPFGNRSQMLVLSDEDTAIRTAKDLAKGAIKTQKYRWY